MKENMHLISANRAPVTAPAFAGQHYLDTSKNVRYTGTTSGSWAATSERIKELVTSFEGAAIINENQGYAYLLEHFNVPSVTIGIEQAQKLRSFVDGMVSMTEPGNSAFYYTGSDFILISNTLSQPNNSPTRKGIETVGLFVYDGAFYFQSGTETFKLNANNVWESIPNVGLASTHQFFNTVVELNGETYIDLGYQIYSTIESVNTLEFTAHYASPNNFNHKGLVSGIHGVFFVDEGFVKYLNAESKSVSNVQEFNQNLLFSYVKGRDIVLWYRNNTSVEALTLHLDIEDTVIGTSVEVMPFALADVFQARAKAISVDAHTVLLLGLYQSGFTIEHSRDYIRRIEYFNTRSTLSVDIII